MSVPGDHKTDPIETFAASCNLLIKNEFSYV